MSSSPENYDARDWRYYQDRDDQREHEQELAKINYVPSTAEVIGATARTLFICAAVVLVVWLLVTHDAIKFT